MSKSQKDQSADVLLDIDGGWSQTCIISITKKFTKRQLWASNLNSANCNRAIFTKQQKTKQRQRAFIRVFSSKPFGIIIKKQSKKGSQNFWRNFLKHNSEAWTMTHRGWCLFFLVMGFPVKFLWNIINNYFVNCSFVDFYTILYFAIVALPT